MLLGRKEDVEVVGVFVDVEKDGLRVTPVVADALDGRSLKVPVVQPATVVV